MTEIYPEDIQSIELNTVATDEVSYPNIKSTINLFFVLLLNTFLFVLIAGIILGVSGLKLPGVKPVLYAAPLLLTIYSAIKRSKKRQGYSTKINFNKFQIWLIPLLIIAAMALIVPLGGLTALIPMPESVHKFFKLAFSTELSSVITAVVAAPILEEIFCRGIVLKGLLKNYSPYKAILVSAIFFATIHLNPWQGISAFFSGLFLGWIYYKTQSVIPGMIIHAVINSSVTVFLFLPAGKQDLINLLGMPYYIIALALSILIFVGVCFIVNRKSTIIPGSVI